MKLIHWAIIFIIIIVPFSLVCRNLINTKFTVLKDEVRINNVIDSATQDAIDQIIELSDEFGLGKRISLNPAIVDASIERFFNTMAVNFNLPYNKGKTKRYFESYIPAILVIGYDGVYVYSAEKTSEGIEHVLKPKIPYAYKDEYGNIINFTLDNYITICINGIAGTDKNKVFSGNITGKLTEQEDKYEEFKSVPIEYLPNVTEDLSMILYALKYDSIYSIYNFDFEDFLKDGNPIKDYAYDELGNLIEDAGVFHQKRREVIINTILSILEEEVMEHNTFAESLGVSYVFNIPDVSKLQWNNTIDDVSFLAFFQGMPIGVDSYYNNFALGGSRIIRTTYIYGDVEGYYHREFCPKVGDPDLVWENDFIDNIFINRIHAAKEGYYPCPLCRP